MHRLSILSIHLCAALIPLIFEPASTPPGSGNPVDWPREIGGVELTRVALSDQERGYYRDFPGRIARFLAGDREVVIRTVDQPSRKLHPAADCLRGSGYRVSPQPARRDLEGGFWGCVLAEKAGQKLRVCEQIEDSAGRSWYDVSSWYWAALLGGSTGPWRALTIAERI